MHSYILLPPWLWVVGLYTFSETVLQYIASLTGTTSVTGTAQLDRDLHLPQYDPSSELNDFEKASTLKQEAIDAKDSGDITRALELYNQAIVVAPPSALLYASRALVLEALGYYQEAVDDCTKALEQNPDSAKAYKIRGKLLYQKFNDWHGALSDLNQAQAIDFDPDVSELLKELTQLRKEEELEQAHVRMEQEQKLKQKAQDIKKAQAEANEAAARESSASHRSAAAAGGMPFGMPGGMPGGMDPSMMAGLMSDPDLQEAMKNPKVMSALQDLMSGPGGPMGLLSNPGKLQQLMSDPEVGPFLQKLMGKFMGGGGAGMMPPMGGETGGQEGNDFDMDDIPDLHGMD
jgi:suppressor of tumorigenicity protein 13